MRKGILALTLAALLAGPVSVGAQEKSPTEHLDEVLSQVLGVLRLALAAIPEYEMPEVMPNGDIVIRRIHPPMDDPAEEKPEPRKPPAKSDDKGVRT